MQKIRKILRAVSEIFKDGRTNGLTDMGDYIGPLSGKPGVQNKYFETLKYTLMMCLQQPLFSHSRNLSALKYTKSSKI